MKQERNSQLFRACLNEAYDDLGLPSMMIPEDVIARALVHYEKALIYRDTDLLSTPTLIAPQPPSLSKLEHFAGLAMQGICANQDLLRIWASQIDAGKISKELEQMITKASVKTAKALLQELQTQGEE